MQIEERLGVEFDCFGDEAAIGVVGGRLDCRGHAAEEFGQGVRLEGHAGDDAEPAAAAFERPEEIGIRTGVGDSDLAVGGHDLGLEEARAGHAVGFGETAEAAAEHQAGDAHRHAAAPLHVAPALGRHRVIGLAPICARLDRHRRLRV